MTIKTSWTIALTIMIGGCTPESAFQDDGGSDAVNGQNGQNGVDGKDGIDGQNGVDGQDGKDGAPGAQGPQGPAGIDGISCWDLNGNGVDDIREDVNHDGVVDVEDCRGEQGIQGVPGTNGTNGEDGASCTVTDVGNGVNVTCGTQTATVYDGATGPQGPAGAKGATGMDGINADNLGFDYVPATVAQCPNGGYVARTWTDYDGDALLDVNEMGSLRSSPAICQPAPAPAPIVSYWAWVPDGRETDAGLVLDDCKTFAAADWSPAVKGFGSITTWADVSTWARCTRADGQGTYAATGVRYCGVTAADSTTWPSGTRTCSTAVYRVVP